MSFLDYVTKINNAVNSVVWGWPVIILILGTGILLTVRLRAMQVRKFKESINETIVPTVKEIFHPKKTESKKSKAVSQFEAFSAAISGTVGTGNIIGVTSAIMTGGPGAVFWMWISAFFGMITNYSENVLGLYFRKKDKDGNFSGGAFYYIRNGLGKKFAWLAYLASVFCLLAAIGMSGVQTNKISATLTAAVGNNAQWLRLAIGGVVAALVAVIIIGSIKSIGRVASMVVPFMSLLFIAMSLVLIAMHITALPAAFAAIFSNIFSFKPAIAGFGGYLFSQIIKKGMARGVFSNEAGLGSSVIAHSASDTREPVRQGLWGIFEVFLDTFVICTMTALTILTSFDEEYLFTVATDDSATALLAFSQSLGGFGTVTFSIILPLFAFTTILAWSYYGEKAAEFTFAFLKGKKTKIAVLAFKVIYLGMILFASVIESDLVWSLSDTANGLMAIPNLIAVVALSGTIVKITKNYYDRKRGIQVEPMLSAYPELNEEFKRDLQAAAASQNSENAASSAE